MTEMEAKCTAGDGWDVTLLLGGRTPGRDGDVGMHSDDARKLAAQLLMAAEDAETFKRASEDLERIRQEEEEGRKG